MLLVVALVGAATAIFAATIGTLKRHQEGFGIFDRFATRIHVHGVRRWCFRHRIFHVMTMRSSGIDVPWGGSVIHGMHHEQDMRRMGG